MTIFTSEQKKVITLSSLGGALEFYDFIVFVYMAKIIGALFFPAKNPAVSLMVTLSVFAVGYLARPLGGIIFGHIGDRVGRKKTFIATLILMSLPTFLIGLLPTYNEIGLTAAIALIILRLLQGFSVGGEIPGAIVFILETTLEKYRGFATGLILFGINTGLLMGSLTVGLLTHFLSHNQIMIWGWRIPFLAGGIFGVISVYLRRKLQETPAFLLSKQKQQASKLPIKEIMTHHGTALIQGIGITAFEAVIISIIYLFMPTYLSTFFNFSLENLMLLNTLILFFFAFPIVLSSFLSDKFGRKKLILISAIAFLLLPYPLFLLFNAHNFDLVILALTLFAILASPVAGCFTCLLAEQFPTAVRYSGTALAYNLSFGIVGGLTPLIATWLIHFTGNIFAPSFCLISISFIALFTLFFVRETYHSKIL